MRAALLQAAMCAAILSSLPDAAAFTGTMPIRSTQHQRYDPHYTASPGVSTIATVARSNHIILNAMPIFQWGLFGKDKENKNNDLTKELSGEAAREAEIMHRTAKMMEDHKRSQEAAEFTAATMEELAAVLVVGKSKTGAGGGGISLGGDNRRGGVKATFNGQQQLISAEVDPNFLFSSSQSESQGVISIGELNEAITSAMQDGYEKSGKLMEEKIKGLYSQLGLPREPAEKDDQKK